MSNRSPVSNRASVTEKVRRFWDQDSAVYDGVPHHHPDDPAEQAAWTAALVDLLPPPPARVLDCGAGTGFLAIQAARLGHDVTAVDLSAGMLARLQAKASSTGVEVAVVEGPAEQPPPGPFDAVIERHLMWTLPDPSAALRAWREVAPAGRLVLFEGLWGQADPWHLVRSWTRRLAHLGRPERSGHHAEYPAEVRDHMPMGRGTSPSQLVRFVAGSGWGPTRLIRLRDVEWAAAQDRPWPERLIGAPARFAVVAGR